MFIKNLLKSTLVLSLLIASTAAFAQRVEVKELPGHNASTQHQAVMSHESTQDLTPQERARRQTNWMHKNLSITDEQKKKVYDIMLLHFQKVENVKNMSGRNNRRSEMQGINAQRDVALKDVLSDEQYQKYQAHLEEIQQLANDRKAGGMN